MVARRVGWIMIRKLTTCTYIAREITVNGCSGCFRPMASTDGDGYPRPPAAAGRGTACVDACAEARRGAGRRYG